MVAVVDGDAQMLWRLSDGDAKQHDLDRRIDYVEQQFPVCTRKGRGRERERIVCQYVETVRWNIHAGTDERILTGYCVSF